MPAELTRTLKPGMYGKDVQALRIVGHNLLGQDPPSAALSIQRKFNGSMSALVKAMQDDLGVPKNGWVGPATMEELNDADKACGGCLFKPKVMKLLDEYADSLKPRRKVPDLGPVVSGGRSVLLQDLTHETDGVPGYPAFDDGWVIGKPVIAPEPVTVTAQSGSQGGDAFFARGASKIEYWIGHIAVAPATGRAFSKGQKMATIAYMPTPHVHCGINAKPLIGHELAHHTNYTHGAPTVGEQLRKWANA